MPKHKVIQSTVAIAMALLISHVPQLAAAEVAGQMITTAEVVSEMTRAQAQESVQTHIERAEVKNELEKLGLSTKEISARMASLSDAELRDLSKQMDKAQYGGSAIGILLVVVLVLLIIYLAKRV